uniref:Uncharacterized protein n=1 Tax=Oryza meridionalis TaxID=40149 RepID=A0A0E0DF88_9ORYZ
MAWAAPGSMGKVRTLRRNQLRLSGATASEEEEEAGLPPWSAAADSRRKKRAMLHMDMPTVANISASSGKHNASAAHTTAPTAVAMPRLTMLHRLAPPHMHGRLEILLLRGHLRRAAATALLLLSGGSFLCFVSQSFLFLMFDGRVDAAVRRRRRLLVPHGLAPVLQPVRRWLAEGERMGEKEWRVEEGRKKKRERMICGPTCQWAL